MFTIVMISTTCTFLGTLMIAFAALRVHHRVLHDHKIDGPVFKDLQREMTVGMLGVLLTVIGYMIELCLFFI